jgi:hypothetical protein
MSEASRDYEFCASAWAMLGDATPVPDRERTVDLQVLSLQGPRPLWVSLFDIPAQRIAVVPSPIVVKFEQDVSLDDRITWLEDMVSGLKDQRVQQTATLDESQKDFASAL